MPRLFATSRYPIGVNDEDDPNAIPNAVPIVPDQPKPQPAPQPITATPIAAATPKTPIQTKYDQDQAELQRLQKSGSGISQLTHPVDAQGNPDTSKHPGFWKKFGSVAARIGDVAGTALFPGVTAQIPGTELHHDVLLNQQQGRVNSDLATEQQQAQTHNLELKPELDQSKLELSQQKVQNAQEAAEQKLSAQLAQHGFKKDANGAIVPLTYEEMSQEQQAVHDLKVSQQEMADAQAAYKKAQKDNVPLQMEMARRRIETAQQNSAIAAERLGLSKEQFANKLREQELIKPSGQTQSRGSAAQTALDVLPGLIETIKKNAKTMGPLMGRIARGEIAIGNVDPKTAEVYTALKSMYALQPAVHGFRNAEFVKDFESAVGNIERNPEGVIGGLQGLKPTLEKVRDEGKTFHHRTVANNEEGGAGNQGGGGHIIEVNGKRYQYKGTGDTADLKNYNEIKGGK